MARYKILKANEDYAKCRLRDAEKTDDSLGTAYCFKGLSDRVRFEYGKQGKSAKDFEVSDNGFSSLEREALKQILAGEHWRKVKQVLYPNAL